MSFQTCNGVFTPNANRASNTRLSRLVRRLNILNPFACPCHSRIKKQQHSFFLAYVSVMSEIKDIAALYLLWKSQIRRKAKQMPTCLGTQTATISISSIFDNSDRPDVSISSSLIGWRNNASCESSARVQIFQLARKMFVANASPNSRLFVSLH